MRALIENFTGLFTTDWKITRPRDLHKNVVLRKYKLRDIAKVIAKLGTPGLTRETTSRVENISRAGYVHDVN